MKKMCLLVCVFVFFTASKCDNEPLEGEFATDEEVSCDFAIENVLSAAIAFSEATSSTYEQLCLEYKTAIENQILFCGDPDGSLQELLDSIGDCSTNVEIENCNEAEEALAIAQTAFEEATVENYTQLCLVYREALITYIELCGSNEEVLLALNELGNCSSQPNAEGILTVTIGTLDLDFDIINVFQNGNILQVAAETGSPTYHIIYFEIAFGETGDDIINDTFALNFSSQYLPSSNGLDDFTSTITTNTPGNVIGTFSGIVTNADGADLSLTSGVISVAY